MTNIFERHMVTKVRAILFCPGHIPKDSLTHGNDYKKGSRSQCDWLKLKPLNSIQGTDTPNNMSRNGKGCIVEQMSEKGKACDNGKGTTCILTRSHDTHWPPHIRFVYGILQRVRKTGERFDLVFNCSISFCILITVIADVSASLRTTMETKVKIISALVRIFIA